MVKVRKYKGKRGGFQVDIRFMWPDGDQFRERKCSPVPSRSGSKRWGEAREAALLSAGKAAFIAKSVEKKEVPTLVQFQNRFIDGYAVANRQKASTVATKKRILRLHLVPLLGDTPLDAIDDEKVQLLKAKLHTHGSKTVNNILNVLSRLLHVAVEWKVIERMPCTIKLLRTVTPVMAFYEFDEYERLVQAARKVSPLVALMVLLAGDAGLRRGEILGLQQDDIDLKRGVVHVQRAIWQGVEDVPKGGRGRIVPLTTALAEALRANRHLRGDRVLYANDGSQVDENTLQEWMETATRRAGLAATRSLHILRHTFCSHLAMRGAPAKAIQELAGHQSLTTTMRYMHLSPAARESAIALLNERGGNGLATAGRATQA